ncbi:MAG TPA: hypothetical protein P5149_14600 [Candidatus Competibacteraceae bacterium]|nr:hypothetical protein [Candidatus Competibacteraceae bacterium]MCP5134420.1 hypothetical protein [Gammaproteobacteria bacterium]HPF60132.1 hypothetical protein [Candidatus Competibacteraceae bacterium]HRY19619.1 hypothetical protein [Candidatus Competibacteraceae bacterium]
MTDQNDMQHPDSIDAPSEEQRRTFLRGLGRWSQAVIGCVLLGSGLAVSQSVQAGGWINRRGGWGGGGWVNRGGGSAGWINGGGGGGWINGGGGGWVNRGGSWINGGGGGWVNRRGGGGVGWINRR